MEYDLIIDVDGACSGNPGMTGIGGIIRNSQNEILYMFSGIRDGATNNEAQYLSIIEALEYITSMSIKPENILIQTDSHLILAQVIRRNNILCHNLKVLIDRVHNLKQGLNCNINFLWIPEENNFFARALAYKAANMPMALVENNNIIPWEEDLNHVVMQEQFIWLPEIDAQTKLQISYLNNSKVINPCELISLMTNGIDKYSRAKHENLLKFIDIRFGNNTSEYLIKVLGDLNSFYSKNVLRWTARGLKPNVAFRKAAIELEIKETI